MADLILGKYKRQMQRDVVLYKFGLVTKEYVFYYVPTDQDVVMFDINMKVISDNYFAQEEYSNQLAKLFPTKGWVWADNATKYNAKQIYNEYKENDML